ncbi:hypothetical protein [[Mycobacterium] nativiensis]|uniref:Cytidine deaminase n=1 Tax=[Mycobacterium] nativiensis TaxID=2855503 RepID=A0ABU5XUZ5_9MYCO|nr:hypothetical protein [Mycolicibacter sp. MYC340]MEB3031758.1 hypothetical protein [Mycolicibacter sp. MYC340]
MSGTDDDSDATLEADGAIADLTDAEADNAADIAAGRYVVATALTAALDALHRAHRAATVLVSRNVYDIAFAEGQEGNDVIAFISDGQRLTRAALALATSIIAPDEAPKKRNVPK